MERNRFQVQARPAARGLRLLAVAVAGLVTLGACAGDDGEAKIAGRVTARPKAAPTTTVASALSGDAGQPTGTPTTKAPATKPPSAPATTTPPAVPQPAGRFVEGVPQVTATPAGGIIGTPVHIEGHGFTDDNWKFTDTSLWLVGPFGGCAVYAEASHSVRVRADGHLSGEFTVPAWGNCRQGSADEGGSLGPGTYRIAYQCTACFIGEFEILPPAPHLFIGCNDVGFAPNSDNLASNIRAAGIPCPEAEALVRKVGGPLGPINGAPQAEADGFVCTRVAESDDGLPMATYECTNGHRQTITFDRT